MKIDHAAVFVGDPEVVDRRAGVAALHTYYLSPSVRGDLVAQVGRTVEARVEFQHAAGLTAKATERPHLLARTDEC